jgi:hypothetical protein
VEYIGTIEDPEIQQKIRSVFLIGLQSTFHLSAVLAGIALLGGLFISGQRLTREVEEGQVEESEALGEEDIAETIARVVERRFSGVERRPSITQHSI